MSVLETCQCHSTDTSMSLHPLYVFHSPSLLLHPSPLEAFSFSQSLTRAFKKAKCQTTNLLLKLLFELLSLVLLPLPLFLAPSNIQKRERERYNSLAGGLITCFALDALNWFPLTPAISQQIAERTSSSVKTLMVGSQITHYTA